METAIIHEVQDFTYLTWAKIRNSSGTAESFLKAYSELQGKRYIIRKKRQGYAL